MSKQRKVGAQRIERAAVFISQLIMNNRSMCEYKLVLRVTVGLVFKPLLLFFPNRFKA